MNKASPKAVGGFVLGAVAIAVLAVIVFGSGKLFQHRLERVAFFQESLQGLRVGAPVQFQGVQVGTVKEIYVQMDAESLDFLIPVILEISLDLIRGGRHSDGEPGPELSGLIDRGLRARLVPQSLVTGQQGVELNFYPDTPARIVESDLPYVQIPTVPSTVQEIKRSLGEVMSDISRALSQINEFFADNGSELSESVTNFNSVMIETKTTMSSLQEAASNIATITEVVNENKDLIQALIRDSGETVLAYKSLAERSEAVIAKNEGRLTQAIDGLRQAESAVSDMAQQAEAMLEENRSGIQRFTNDGLYEIRNLAVDAQAAVEQFRRILEEMERDPARFFLGKPGQVEIQ